MILNTMKSTAKMTDEDYELIDAAKETLDRLYRKDKHEVAAALRTKSSKIYTGIHTEASVGFADVCGEVAAICHAIAHGESEYQAIVAIWKDPEGSYRLLSPCGRCRELISDFSEDTLIIVGSLDDPYKVKISDLLPMKNA
jgi:cytidine deaminase